MAYGLWQYVLLKRLGSIALSDWHCQCYGNIGYCSAMHAHTSGAHHDISKEGQQAGHKGAHDDIKRPVCQTHMHCGLDAPAHQDLLNHVVNHKAEHLRQLLAAGSAANVSQMPVCICI